MAKKKSGKSAKQVAALTHEDATRKNIPTAEMQSLAERVEEMRPVPPAHYPRATPLPKGATRDREGDLDPQIIWNGVRIRLTKEQIRALEEKGQIEVGEAQLVWRGKDTQDWSDLIVQVPPLYIQEKIHPKVIIDDLIRRTKEKVQEETDAPDLFADFNGIDPEAKLEFYQHDQHWVNRMILGDSLQVMASLAEREGLRGKVQCIYFDPPYGIKFNSNWQVSTQSRDVKDGKREDISREPEQVKAFRDTWKDGFHSYLTYLRDRLTVAKELLAESGSIFIQIGDENMHRVRAVMDEVFGPENSVSLITFKKTAGLGTDGISNVCDYLLWYGKNREFTKTRPLYVDQDYSDDPNYVWIAGPSGEKRRLNRDAKESGEIPDGWRLFRHQIFLAAGRTESCIYPIEYQGSSFMPTAGRSWSTHKNGTEQLIKQGRITKNGSTLNYIRFADDFGVNPLSNFWPDGASGVGMDKTYVVQTNLKIVQRCLLMASDPGDLILDPTCGSGTSAFVAEQWGRRWITIDTSRVALALARTRIMAAKYPYYYLMDSPAGRQKEQEVTGKVQPSDATRDDIRLGFVCERAPHITLRAIANNGQADVIWEEAKKRLEPLREQLNAALGKKWAEWEIPLVADPKWDNKATKAHQAWWDARIARQKKMDESIARNADVEYLYDRPYEDRSRVRVAGPFTVESLSPHRVVPADEEELLDLPANKRKKQKFATPPTDFAEMVLENLKTSGVQQSKRQDKLTFTSLTPWPGTYVNAEGQFMEGNTTRRAAIFIGPEFGTVTRTDLVAAAREATDARFDVLIACAFNFDAHSSELMKLGPLTILKAKMNPDLHMADDLKNTGKGNLFVVFGEPDIEIHHSDGGMIEVKVKGVDVFDPNTGEIRSNDVKDIAAWFIDTDYNEESFFVRHAYFLGAQDPYKSLKTALKAEIDPEAWEALYRETSRPFPRPSTGRIAVKVINHFGDEVMKVFNV